MAFVKLDCGLLDSSLWSDQVASRVFLTALLMAVPRELEDGADQIEIRGLTKAGWFVPPGWYGWVPASGQGLLSRAMVDKEEGLLALERLSSPDADSRTPDYDGRRLARVGGGFVILNYARYRQRDMTGAERARRWRERHQDEAQDTGEPQETPVTRDEPLQEPTSGPNDTVLTRDATPVTRDVTVPSQKEKEKEKEKKRKETPEETATRKAAVGAWTSRFPGSVPPAARIWKALRGLVKQHGEEAVMLNWRRYLAEQEAPYISPEAFSGKYPWVTEESQRRAAMLGSARLDVQPEPIATLPKPDVPRADPDAVAAFGRVLDAMGANEYERTTWYNAASGAVVPVGMADDSTIRIWLSDGGKIRLESDRPRVSKALEKSGLKIVLSRGEKA